MSSRPSRRAELARLRQELAALNAPLVQVAAVIGTRFGVNARTAWRLAHGWTQQQVADRWNELWPAAGLEVVITHKHISYWEAWPAPTGRAPSLVTLNRLARIYQASPAALLDENDRHETALPAPAAMVAREAAASAAVAVPSQVGALARAGASLAGGESAFELLVAELVEWACRMNRRDLLQTLSWAASAAAAAPVLAHLDTDTRQQVARTDQVDGTVVDHIEAVLWHCMRQDDALGPQAVLETVLAQRQLARALLIDASSQIRDRLLSLYANLSRFAGWLSFDLGNFEAATEYYETARTAAHEAHDTELGAFVLCNMSHLATWRRRPRIGIDHALAALGWAAQTDDARLLAYAHDVAARAYAMDGQERAARRAVDQARAVLDRESGETSVHVYFYGAGLLASTETNCLLALNQADRGAASAQRALDSIDGSFVRNRVFATLDLGMCRLRGTRPDVDGGATAIGEAATLAAGLRSARLADRFRTGWAALEPWRDSAAVRDARQRISALGPDPVQA